MTEFNDAKLIKWMHASTSNHVEVSQNLIRNEAAVGRADLETVRMKDTNHDLHLPL